MQYVLDGWTFELGDDGTLDTVVYSECPSGHVTRDGFSLEASAPYRNAWGYMTEEGFAAFVEDDVAPIVECHACLEQHQPDPGDW